MMISDQWSSTAFWCHYHYLRWHKLFEYVIICLRYSPWTSGNLFQTLHERNLTMLWVRKGIELVAGLICPLSSRLSRFASTARRAPLQICAEVFLYCFPLKWSTFRQSKKLGNEFFSFKTTKSYSMYILILKNACVYMHKIRANHEDISSQNFVKILDEIQLRQPHKTQKA
jgi:hypothetical protein